MRFFSRRASRAEVGPASTSAAGDDDSATPLDAESSASREAAVVTIGRTLAHARERKTLPDFREMVALLTEIERLTNYSTVVSIALSAAAKCPGAYVGELRDAYMKMWLQWHNHKDEPKYRADRLLTIAARDGAHISPDSEIGWMLLSVMEVWVREGAPDRTQYLTEHFGPVPTLDEVNEYQGIGPKQQWDASEEIKGVGNGMDDKLIANLVYDILAHPSPVVFGTVDKDVQEYLDQLQRGGEAAVQPILISVTDCARGNSGGNYWWLGAQELCSLLARIGSAEAMSALLQILEINSRIVEYGYVRATAAGALVAFRDPQLLPRLLRCLEMPDAPVLAINKTIVALGGDASSLPKVIVAEGRDIEDPREAVRYYRQYQPQVAGWPSSEDQGGFYAWFGIRVERIRGTEAALPLFAASLVANPGANAAAWGRFPSVPKTSEGAKALAEKYPLTPDYLASVDAADERPAKQPPSLAEKGQSENWHLRCSYAKDPQAAPEKLEELIQNDPVMEVREAACSNPNTPARVLEEFGRLGSSPLAEIVAGVGRRGRERGLWETVAANPNTPLTVLERLASLDTSEDALQQLSAKDRETAVYFVERVLWGAAENPNTPAEYLERFSKNPNYRIRIRAAKNRSTPSHALQMLARDPEQEIRKAAEENPSFRPR